VWPALPRPLLDRGYPVEFVHDAIAALDEQKAARFLDVFSKRAGRLVETDDLLRETKQRSPKPFCNQRRRRSELVS